MEYVNDFINGKSFPNIGAEENRQKIEKFLVEEKGFLKEDIQVDACFKLEIGGEPYSVKIALLIVLDGKIIALIKPVAGSISSWEREVVAVSRVIIEDYQVPFSMVSDGKDASVLDTLSGKKISSSMDSIPSREELLLYLLKNKLIPFPEEKRERQKLVFRTYDMMTVNR